MLCCGKFLEVKVRNTEVERSRGLSIVEQDDIGALVATS